MEVVSIRWGRCLIGMMRPFSPVEDAGDEIEGEDLDDVIVAGVVTHTIIDVRSDSVAV